MCDHDYLIGDRRFSPTSGELTQREPEQAPVRLEPKVAAVLECLLRNPGAVIAKETLISTVWPDTFVTDSALFRHISLLRRALGDDARNPRYIETVPKRGYRLAAPVCPVPAPPSSEYRASRRGLPPPERRRRVAGTFLAATAAATLVALAWFWRPAAAPGISRAAPTPMHNGDPATREAVAIAQLFEDRVECDSYRKARTLLESTLARDAGFLPAYGHLIDVSVASAVLGCGPSREALQRVEATLSAARDHGLDAAEYHRVRGHLLLWQRWTPNDAGREFERSRELAATGGASDVGYAAALAALDRPAEAIAEGTRALREEPTHPGTNWTLGVLLYFGDRPDEAVAQLRRSLELFPGFAPAENLLALILLRQGKVQAALHVVASGSHDDAVGDRFASARALVYAAAGDGYAASRVRHAWERRADEGWVPPTAMALLYAGLGEHGLAIQWLSRAIEEGDAWSVLLPIDPTFEALRVEAAFRELLDVVRRSPTANRP